MKNWFNRKSVWWYAVAASLGMFLTVPSLVARPAPAPRAEVTISIYNFRFNADVVRVKVGTEVTWINHDDAPHKIASTDRTFTSPVLDTDGRFSYTFTVPGTYAYYCSLHPMMTGKVVVQ